MDDWFSETLVLESPAYVIARMRNMFAKLISIYKYISLCVNLVVISKDILNLDNCNAR